MNSVYEPKPKYHRLILNTAQKSGGTVLDAYYSTEGAGLGGTIKHGGVYVEALFSDSTAGAGTPYIAGASGSVLTIASGTFPFTDTCLKYNATRGAITESSGVFQILRNNFGNAAGTSFSYVNAGDNANPQCCMKFENWNTAQPLNIKLECLDGTALTAADFTDHQISLVIVEYPRPVGMPLNQNQRVGQ